MCERGDLVLANRQCGAICSTTSTPTKLRGGRAGVGQSQNLPARNPRAEPLITNSIFPLWWGSLIRTTITVPLGRAAKARMCGPWFRFPVPGNRGSDLATCNLASVGSGMWALGCPSLQATEVQQPEVGGPSGVPARHDREETFGFLFSWSIGPRTAHTMPLTAE